MKCFVKSIRLFIVIIDRRLLDKFIYSVHFVNMKKQHDELTDSLKK